MRQPRAWALSENAFAQQVVDLAHLLGWSVDRPWRSVRSPAGFPAVVRATPGHPLMLAERTSDRGTRSPAQRAWLDLLAAVPGIQVVVWRPRDWEAIVATHQDPKKSPETPGISRVFRYTTSTFLGCRSAGRQPTAMVPTQRRDVRCHRNGPA